MTAPAGPYIVSQRRPLDWSLRGDLDLPEEGWPASRWAYSTLENHGDYALVPLLRKLLAATGFSPWGMGGWVRDDEGAGTCYDDCWALREAAEIVQDEHGGTIKLPDGSEIVVEATTYERLWDDLTDRPPFIVGVDCTIWVGRDGVEDARWGAAILAAWNAEYGIGSKEKA